MVSITIALLTPKLPVAVNPGKVNDVASATLFVALLIESLIVPLFKLNELVAL